MSAAARIVATLTWIMGAMFTWISSTPLAPLDLTTIESQALRGGVVCRGPSYHGPCNKCRPAEVGHWRCDDLTIGVYGEPMMSQSLCYDCTENGECGGPEQTCTPPPPGGGTPCGFGCAFWDDDCPLDWPTDLDVSGCPPPCPKP
jgi:hypothetical protein